MNTDPIIDVSGLARGIDMAEQRLEILSAVDLRVMPGESVAITGESGSGKSTLLGLLAGLDIADSGDIVVLGENFKTMDEDQRADFRRHHSGFVFQSFHLVASHSALENVMLPLELQAHKGAAKDDNRATAVAMLQRVGLGHRIDHFPHQLSGGEQQRVALARAFVGEPSILYADEPTGNLDAATSEKVVDLMFELNADRGTTLLLVTHENALAARCERHLVLRNGRLEDAK